MGQEIPNPRPLGHDDLLAAVREAAEVYGERMFIVVGRGSLSISLPLSAASLRMTADIDLFAPFRPDRVNAWAEADRFVSVESEFFVKHGFYIERVGEWTLMSQPPGWQDRAIALKVDDIDVLVLHALDLAYNKLEAGRRKDLEFMREGLDCSAYKLDEVKAFVADHAPDEVTRELILKNLEEAAT